MDLEFKIIKIISHHNSGLLIVTKYLGDKTGLTIEDGAILGDIPVYHYKEAAPVIDNIKQYSFQVQSLNNSGSWADGLVFATCSKPWTSGAN